MSDNNVPVTKPAIFVKNADAKKGSLWNKLTNHRIIKQHGGFEIPENDAHAVKKFYGPDLTPKDSPEETAATLSDIEKEIQQLKGKDKQSFAPIQNQQNPDDDEDEFLE